MTSKMSRLGGKRLKSTDVHNISRKRRKLEVPRKKPKSRQPESNISVATLSASELPWKEITPPERLGDAEGFLGLEEIDDVEIVRDSQGKQTRFRVRLSTFSWDYPPN